MGIFDRLSLQSQIESRWDGPAIRPLSNAGPGPNQRTWGFLTFNAFWFAAVANVTVSPPCVPVRTVRSLLTDIRFQGHAQWLVFPHTGSELLGRCRLLNSWLLPRQHSHGFERQVSTRVRHGT